MSSGSQMQPWVRWGIQTKLFLHAFLLSFLFGIVSPKVHFERNRFPSSRRCNLVFHFEDMMVKEKFGDLITVEGLGNKGSSAPSPGGRQQASLAVTLTHPLASGRFAGVHVKVEALPQFLQAGQPTFCSAGRTLTSTDSATAPVLWASLLGSE